MRFRQDVFQVTPVPLALDAEGVPVAFDPRLHVNIPLGFTGDPALPHYVDGTVLVLPDGTLGPDLTPWIVDPPPATPLAVFSGVPTLFLRDTEEPALGATLAAWAAEEAGDAD